MNYPSTFKKVLHSLGAAGTAALLAGAGLTRAAASETSIHQPGAIERGNDTSVVAVVATKPKAAAKMSRDHLIFRGRDSMVYFKHGKVAREGRSLVSPHRGATQPSTKVNRADKDWVTIGPETYNPLTMEFEDPWPFGPVSNQ